jgi:hypothetical protein
VIVSLFDERMAAANRRPTRTILAFVTPIPQALRLGTRSTHYLRTTRPPSRAAIDPSPQLAELRQPCRPGIPIGGDQSGLRVNCPPAPSTPEIGKLRLFAVAKTLQLKARRRTMRPISNRIGDGVSGFSGDIVEFLGQTTISSAFVADDQWDNE